jgi:hypothetical protein
VGRSEGRSEERSGGRSVGRSEGRSEERSGGRSVGRSVGRSEERSGGRSVGRSVGRSEERSGGRSEERSGGRTKRHVYPHVQRRCAVARGAEMSDELTRLRLENNRLRFELGVLGMECEKLRVMLATALQTKSRAVDAIAADAIRKAAAK